jgi:hypothetical protein
MEVGPGDLPPIATVLSHKAFIDKRQFAKNYRFPDGSERFANASRRGVLALCQRLSQGLIKNTQRVDHQSFA